jgi:diadenosine tetraphosphate (Ap4A) HIT family hydrolase
MAEAEPTVFTRIIRGELPGRFVWRDEDVVAFLTIAPIRPGHTLVVPVAEVDHWIDVDPELWSRVAAVQHTVGRALMAAFQPERVGVMIAGLEVPHCHVHLIPIENEADLSFANADPGVAPEDLDDAAARIRSALRALGAEGVAEA